MPRFEHLSYCRLCCDQLRYRIHHLLLQLHPSQRGPTVGLMTVGAQRGDSVWRDTFGPMIRVTAQTSGERTLARCAGVWPLAEGPAYQHMALVAYVDNLCHSWRQGGVRAMATGTGRRGEIRLLKHSIPMGTLPVLAELIHWYAVTTHQGFVFMAARTGRGDVGGVHVAARVLRGKDRVRVMTVGAGWSVVITPLQQQLTVATRSELSQLVGGEAILAHLPCIGVARGA